MTAIQKIELAKLILENDTKSFGNDSIDFLLDYICKKYSVHKEYVVDDILKEMKQKLSSFLRYARKRFKRFGYHRDKYLSKETKWLNEELIFPESFGNLINSMKPSTSASKLLQTYSFLLM